MLARNGWSTTQSLQARSFLRFGAKTTNPEDGDIVVLRPGRDGWSDPNRFVKKYRVHSWLTASSNTIPGDTGLTSAFSPATTDRANAGEKVDADIR